MKATDDVFVLIKSLTKSEKRYFKLFAARQESEADCDYLQLFELLDSTERHDEDALRKALGPEKGRYLPQTKYYLYRSILRALNQFHATSSSEAQINELLQAFDILFEKRLYGQCRKLLAKARKLTLRIDSPVHLTQILLNDYHLAVLEPDGNRARDEVKAIFDELVSLSDTSALRFRYWRVQALMFIGTKHRQANRPGERSELDELMSDPVLASGEPHGDPFAQLLYYYIHHHYASGNAEQENTYLWARKIVDLVESEPAIRCRLFDRYLPSLHNLCLATLHTNRLEEFDQEYRKLLAVAAKVREQNPNFDDLQVRMLGPRKELGQGNFAGATALLEPLEHQFRSAGDTLRIGFGVYFNYMFAYSYFGAGHYRRALTWLGNIINDRNVSTHEDIHCRARLLNLLVHYELGNHENLEFFVASTVRFLTRRNRMLRMESLAIEMFRKLIGATGAPAVRRVFVESLGKLRAMDESDANAGPVLDLTAWIESKITGESFATLVRQRLAAIAPPPAPAIARAADTSATRSALCA